MPRVGARVLRWGGQQVKIIGRLSSAAACGGAYWDATGAHGLSHLPGLAYAQFGGKGVKLKVLIERQELRIVKLRPRNLRNGQRQRQVAANGG